MVSNRQLFLRHVAQTSDHCLQFEIKSASGVYFYNVDDRPYIDLVSGVAVSNLGHGHPAVVHAIKEQVDKYLHTMVYGEFVQSPQVRYAEWIASHLPDPLDNVFFVCSGSEAIDGAIKLARRYTGRHELRAFYDAYHGGTHGALSILGDSKSRSGFLPLLPGVKHMKFNCLEDLNIIDSNTAAVIAEPIQAEAGIIEPEKDFLKRVRKRCDETGALLILDEIQTGFGRTGKLFAFEHYGIIPDILCLAKSFGGGMPLGAFVSSREIMSRLTYDPPLGHLSTFGGHPVSCAAGLAAQSYMVEHDLIVHSRKMGEIYRSRLNHPSIDHIRGRGLFLAVVLKKEVQLTDFLKKTFEHGLIIDKFLFSGNAFRIAPPLIIGADDVNTSIDKIISALDSLSE